LPKFVRPWSASSLSFEHRSPFNPEAASCQGMVELKNQEAVQGISMFASSVLSPGSKLGFYLTNAKKAGEKAHDFQYGPLCIFGLADDQGRNASKQRSKSPVGSAFGPNIGFVRGS
jgi:hypothetical protein